MSTASPIIDITVEGMTCNGCANKVRGAIGALDGVAAVEVDHESGLTRVTPDGTVPADDLEFALDEAVEGVGYRVVS
ncbi:MULTISPECIES: heavy-metal-associated domain-containing protein [Demequina]|uniref:Metal-binding protein n=1 Tax=Demequina litorisediminis TaxID=1849022 RepID=A0ABQ6IDB5_9MICO|nr:heavy metal-associated domain-containing protein [Demequina litorisediminis]GMA35406.1 metal-binding protein [Demequina litorisediminis]